MRDVGELEDLAGAGEVTVDGGEGGTLETDKLGGSLAADPRIVHVQNAAQRVLEERVTAEIMKRCTVRDDIVEVGSRAQIWSMVQCSVGGVGRSSVVVPRRRWENLSFVS